MKRYERNETFSYSRGDITTFNREQTVRIRHSGIRKIANFHREFACNGTFVCQENGMIDINCSLASTLSFIGIRAVSR